MVLEAEKSHDMSPARWSTRKASVIQSESQTLRTRHTAVQSQEEVGVFTQADRAHSPLLHLPDPFRTSMDRVMPQCSGESRLLYAAPQIKCNLFQEHHHGHTWKKHLTSDLGIPWCSQADIKLSVRHPNFLHRTAPVSSCPGK